MMVNLRIRLHAQRLYSDALSVACQSSRGQPKWKKVKPAVTQHRGGFSLEMCNRPGVNSV
jgi:hypothetical protein